MIIVDEPELSLHPQAQKRLAKFLSEESARRQVIICTHSPYFINWEDFLNWAKFVRLNKYNDSKCTIHQLWNFQDYLTGRSLSSYQHPEFLDTVYKEIMFSEKTLFVEWKEDVWLIKKFLDEKWYQINFDIFWYWSWWRPRIEKFLKMAKDLWIKKVWALYDWDVPPERIEEIKDGFSEYLIQQLSTEDIRDKEAEFNQDGSVKRSGKNWIFYEGWRIKPEKEKEFMDIILKFIQHFS